MSATNARAGSRTAGSTVAAAAALLATVALWACFLSSADGEKTAAPRGPSKRVREFLGERVVTILSGADRVEVFRVSRQGGDRASERFRGYPVVAAGKEQGAAFAGKLRDVLFDEKTYQFGSAKGCKFDPGVGLRVWAGGAGPVDMLLCFRCDEFAFWFEDPETNETGRAAEDFDRARPALVRLAKEAFPDDEDIQALEEEAK